MEKQDEVPVTDDRMRLDGGNSTDDERIPDDEMEKMMRNAVGHTNDEPGS